MLEVILTPIFSVCFREFYEYIRKCIREIVVQRCPAVNVTSLSIKMYKTATVKTNKSLGNYQQSLKAHDVEHKCVTMTPSKEVIVFGQDHIVEVTVKKNKGQKRTSPVASCSSEQKAEKKRSATDNSKPPPNWGNVFRQNLLHMTKEQSSKHNEKEVEKNMNTKKQQKSTIKHPIKSDQKHLASCCSSILVRDCTVQCSEYDFNKFVDFNPIYMLHLIKQLKDLDNKKDKRIYEIYIEMEQILQKNLETKDVESTAVLLKESDKKMKAMSYESFTSEQKKLESEIQQRDERLKEVDQKYGELTFQAERLKQQLDEETYKKNDTISRLMQQIENNERTITDLKTNLNKQTELAQKNDIDNKYLIIEIDKLSTLCSYKDTQINDYRNTIQELQSQITKQLKIVNEIYMKEGSTSPQISLIHTGYACSSPTSSFSDDSNKSWNDLSDISSIDSVPKERVLKKDAPIRDFELVSLLDGESSHTILADQNEVTNDKGSIMQDNEDNTCQNMNADDVTVKKSLHHCSKKGHNKENDVHKTRKFTILKEKQNDNIKNLFRNTSKVLENITATKSTVSDIRKQGNIQNRRSINVPSPLRDCPHPDWSDSSLPSISTISNLDMVPSNDA